MEDKHYQQCTRCVLDTSTKLISFDADGVCNFCHQYDKEAKRIFGISPEQRKQNLEGVLSKIRKQADTNQYGCIVGVSGGIDSTYLAHLAVKFDLKPLFVHFDNGWNSELAVQNINNLIQKLGVDLNTYVIDWEDFKDLQKAYFKASVIDVEVPTDQLIFAILYKIAKQYNIKYILEGYNFKTEFGIPMDWTFEEKFDLVNRNNIHKQFGTRKLKNFPSLSKTDIAVYNEINDIHTIDIVNFTDYDHEEVIELLKTQYNYVPYQYKHYESIFTRFYQGYILPKKWGIDKRKAHLSTRVRSGFLTREKALEMLAQPTYPLDQQEADKQYVLKKWDMTEKEFDDIMKQPPVEHSVYGYDKPPGKLLKWRIRLYYIYLYKIAYPLGLRKKTI